MEESNAIDPDPADILADMSVCLSVRAEQDPRRKSVSIQVDVYYLINIYIYIYLPSLKQVPVTVNQFRRN